jgi:hypothetical protein
VQSAIASEDLSRLSIFVCDGSMRTVHIPNAPITNLDKAITVLQPISRTDRWHGRLSLHHLRGVDKSGFAVR